MRIRCDSTRKIDTYAEALETWDRTPPWRSKRGEHDPRPLDSRRKYHISLRKGYDNEIRCALYDTDVITYWPDGRVEFHAYNSQSTDAFAQRLEPSGIHFLPTRHAIGLNAGYDARRPYSRVYRVTNKITVVKKDDHWTLAEGEDPEPFMRLTVNRKKAREVCEEHKFADFQAWVNGYVGLNKEKLVGDTVEHKISYRNVTDFLAAGSSEWIKYPWERREKQGWGRGYWTKGQTTSPLIEHIKKCLYKREGVIEEELVFFLTTWNEVWTLYKHNNRYRGWR